ncbi:MAG: RNB domain-containing ribonuclease [Burkholderiales bacterium]|nr:RNB domain-containing ribonuclease [Burkholderiales bacterium]
MFALFDDAGKFLAGRVMSEADSSMQVELDSGKRVKVKAANVLIKFAKPAPAEVLAQGAAQAADIDVDLIWEVAPDDEFGFDDLAREYFSDNADAVQQAAMLMRLFDTPHYFHRRGKGRFKKAPEDILKQALLAIERKKQQALQIAQWAQELAAGNCPGPIKDQLYKILFKPDKNGAEYKAVVEAAKATQRAPLDLLKDAGAIDSPYHFHFKRFLFEHFPKGTGFPPLEAPPIKDDLPVAPVRAFSIDDSMTTEIDDALSVQGLGTGTVTYGVHIAAPSLAIQPGSPIDALGRARMSTVYMPGHKITMLPDNVVQTYTLQEGRDCPAVSLYVTYDEATLEVKGTESRVERVPIAANLRHDKLDGLITEASLTGEAPADYPFAPELAFAFRLAKHLKAKREEVRGKPETFNRPDYAFKLIGANGENTMSDGVEPTGAEQVVIGTRQRGAPLDLIVAEAMILANSTWGGWLAEMGVPGIYRSQASLAPGIKVRMGTKPAPHAGMGVAQYTWATSPLRRYVDLVNQWQLLALARSEPAPFVQDERLLALVHDFETTYALYADFQWRMERYWSLRWLLQEGASVVAAEVLRDTLLRVSGLPLHTRVPSLSGLAPGTRVELTVESIDLLDADLRCSYRGVIS